MSNGRHFGLGVRRNHDLTHIWNLDRLVADCQRCGKAKPEIYRLRGERQWLCYGCTVSRIEERAGGTKDHSREPEPFNSQPTRMLNWGERLRSPAGVWTVTKPKHHYVTEEGKGVVGQYCSYLLVRDDGHQETWRGCEMVDFHLIPPTEQGTLI